MTMANLFAIKSSVKGEYGCSSQLINLFVEKWESKYPESKTTILDLAANVPPHLTLDTVSVMPVSPVDRTAQQSNDIALSDRLTQEFIAQDVIVMAAPMYNLTIPSNLKTYIDHIVRAGLTFNYSENGPVGLIDNKKIYLICTRGGVYEEETLTVYMRSILGLMGITDITIIVAEGLDISPELQENSMADARAEVKKVVSNR